MFNLLNEKEEKLIRKHSNIQYFIKKSWLSPSIIENFTAPYNIYLIPNNEAKNKISSYFLYTCYINTYGNIIEISNITYTFKSKRYFFLKPNFAYLYLTMTIEKAIEIALLKKKSKLILSSCIPHTLEILLDYNFEDLITCSKTNFQKGTFIIKNNKEKYVNN